MPNRNTIALIASGCIAIGFLIAGLFDILDYFIVKAILFLAFGALAAYIVAIVTKSYESK